MKMQTNGSRAGTRRTKRGAFDGSALTEDAAAPIDARYLARVLEGAFAARRISARHAILDVSPEPSFAVARILSARADTTPRVYVALSGASRKDALPDDFKPSWLTPVDTTLDGLGKKSFSPFDRVLAIGTLDGLPRRHRRKVLLSIFDALEPGGIAVVVESVSNYTEIVNDFDSAGFAVEIHVGIEALHERIREAATSEDARLMRDLSESVPPDAAASIVAARYPHAARRRAWSLRRPATDDVPSTVAPSGDRRSKKRAKKEQVPRTPKERTSKPSRRSRTSDEAARPPRRPRDAAGTSKGFIRLQLQSLGYTPRKSSMRPPRDVAEKIAAAVVKKFSTPEKQRTTKASDIYFVWRNWVAEEGR